MITLLLVDDDPLVRFGLRTWLEQVPDVTVVGETSTSAEAMLLARTLRPDVVLLDISQPPMAAITATASLRTMLPHSAVVLLSHSDDTFMRTQAAAAGAAAFVGKQEGVRVLLAAIQKAGSQSRLPGQPLLEGEQQWSIHS